MAFSVAALRPSSVKHVLAEIDLTVIQDFWASFVAYVWMLDFEQLYDTIDSSLISSVATLGLTRVTSVLEDGVALIEVGSIGDTISTHQRWYWDQADLRLYVNLTNGDEPALHELRIGGAEAFSYTPQVHNGQLYLPRLRSVPTIVKRKDPLYFGRVAFGGGDLVIINTDGAYDTWVEDNDDLYGNPARILLGFDDDAYSDFRVMYSGFVERATVGPDAVTLTVQDLRKQLSLKLPRRTITAAEYPNVKYDRLGHAKPLAYGAIKEAAAIPVEEQASAPATYRFVLADTEYHPLQSIDNVYVAGSAGLIEVTPAATNLSTGEFTLHASAWAPGQEVRVNFAGYPVDNAIGVIEDLLQNYFNIQPTSDFYDLAEWGAATAAAPDIGMYLTEPTDISQIVGDIASSVPGWFLVLDSGLYTFRKYDATATVAATVTAAELMAMPAVQYDTDEVITSVTVLYDRNWSTGAFSRYTDDSREADARSRYKTYRREEFPTLLVGEAAATAYASDILDYFNSVHGAFEIQLKMQLAEREINDLISVYLDRATGTALGLKTVDIVGITKNLDEGAIYVEGRIV